MNKIFTLSVDMLGSETKIHEILKGLEQSLLRNINYKFLLFGDENLIKKKITKFKALVKSVEVINCQEFISMDDKPSEIIKYLKYEFSNKFSKK